MNRGCHRTDGRFHCRTIFLSGHGFSRLRLQPGAYYTGVVTHVDALEQTRDDDYYVCVYGVVFNTLNRLFQWDSVHLFSLNVGFGDLDVVNIDIFIQKKPGTAMASIYIDIDDVLAESHQTFLQVLDKEFGKKATYAQITSFDLKQSFSLTDEEYRHFFECIHEPDEIISHRPVPGARAVMKKWHENGHRISILTGRPADTEAVSLEWLDRQGFTYDTFSIVNKYARKGSEGNGSISLDDLSRQSFDLAVEDSAGMAAFLSETMHVSVALLDRPWNRNFTFNGNVHRCCNWDDIQARFDHL